MITLKNSKGDVVGSVMAGWEFGAGVRASNLSIQHGDTIRAYASDGTFIGGSDIGLKKGGGARIMDAHNAFMDDFRKKVAERKALLRRAVSGKNNDNGMYAEDGLIEELTVAEKRLESVAERLDESDAHHELLWIAEMIGRSFGVEGLDENSAFLQARCSAMLLMSDAIFDYAREPSMRREQIEDTLTSALLYVRSAIKALKVDDVGEAKVAKLKDRVRDIIGRLRRIGLSDGPAPWGKGDDEIPSYDRMLDAIAACHKELDDVTDELARHHYRNRDGATEEEVKPEVDRR